MVIIIFWQQVCQIVHAKYAAVLQATYMHLFCHWKFFYETETVHSPRGVRASSYAKLFSSITSVVEHSILVYKISLKAYSTSAEKLPKHWFLSLFPLVLPWKL